MYEYVRRNAAVCYRFHRTHRREVISEDGMNSIRSRLVMAVLLLALLPAVIVVYGMFVRYRESIVNTAKTNLGLMADKKGEEIEAYIRERKIDTKMLAGFQKTIDDIKTLHQLFLRHGYMSPAYRNEESRIRESYERYIEEYGYHDIFMIDPDGNVILTYKHESDFGVNLYSGPYRDEELARTARIAATTFETGFSQYNYYRPSMELAAFVASPVLDNGRLAGIVAFQLDSQKYEKVIADNPGLGKTVETVIAERVKDKFLFLRSGEYRPGVPVTLAELPMTRNDTPSLKGLAGERGEGILLDYRGVEVIAAWRYLPTAHISLAVKISTEEALAQVHGLERIAYVALSVIVLLMILFGVWIGRAIIMPIGILEKATAALARGDLAQRVQVGAADEMGHLAESFNTMAEHLEKATTGLEEEVRERTRSLAASNEKLARIINEMETVEGKLRDTTAFQRAILDSANYSIISTDVNGTIKSWNRGAEKMLGYLASEVVDKETPVILHDPGEVQQRAKELSEELGFMIQPGFDVFIAKARLGVPDENDWTYRRKDGSTFPVRLSVTALFNEQKQITGYLGVGFDITDQKIAERSLKWAKENAEMAAEEARKANQYKSEFLANMSHEIRTPLNAIIGMADLLGETRLDDEQQRYLNVFRGASESLLYLINDILDFAKIEAGQLDLEETEFDLKETLDMAVGIVLPRARQKGLPILLNFERPPCNYLMGDPVRLRQVLLNLMSNAVKFTSKGIISVNVAYERIGDSLKAEIAVSDEGIGIPNDKLPFLFERFRQADASVTRKYGGTGLGLAISKMLAEKMHGGIHVASEYGRGSTFTFSAQFKLGRSKEAVIGDNDLAGMSILMYFEDEVARRGIAGLLEGTGVSIRQAGTESELQRELFTASASETSIAAILTGCDVNRGNACKLAAELGRESSGIGEITMLTIASSGICMNRPEGGTLGPRCRLVSPIGRKELIKELREIWVERKKTKIAVEQKVGDNVINILLVDDAKDNQLLAKAYLKKGQYRIDTAENGQEAVEKFMVGAYDLVLMDVQMPIKDGYTATREIRAYEKEHNKPRTPVIALTANAYQKDVDNSIEAGCDAHITKPIKKDRLIAAIEAILKRT